MWLTLSQGSELARDVASVDGSGSLGESVEEINVIWRGVVVVVVVDPARNVLGLEGIDCPNCLMSISWHAH